MTNQNPKATLFENPGLVRKIDKTTYHVKAHFSTTVKENMSDKIKRMLRSEANKLCNFD